MKKTILIILLLVVMFVASCDKTPKDGNKFHVVDIESNINNMEEIFLSQFTDNIQYVTFENSPSVVLNNNPPINVSDNLLLTYDPGKSLLMFDISGRLINKFGDVGRGPGEYQFTIDNLCFDGVKKILFNSGTDLFEFNTDGSFLNKYSDLLMVDNTYFLHQWSIVDDSLIFGHIQNNSGQTEYKAILINKNGNVKRYYQNFDLLENRQSRVNGGTTQIFKYNMKLYFKEQFVDTLFSLNADYDLVPEYCFNLGDLKMPSSVRASFYEYFEKMYDYVALEDVIQTKDYLFLKVNYGNRFPAKRLTPKSIETSNSSILWTNTLLCLGIYDKNSGELLFCKPTSTDNPYFTSGLYNDIDAGPRFFPIKQIDDYAMLMTISAKELKDHVASNDFKNTEVKYPEKKLELQKLADSLTEFDNPVLMLMTLKK